jgi:hypothetical protein
MVLARGAQLLAHVLQMVHRVIATFLIQQAGLQRNEAHTGVVTLIQRFGSAANLNIRLHCLVLIGVYRTTMGGVETQQLSQQGAYERPRLQAEQHQHAEQRLYTSISEAQRRSPFPFPSRWAGQGRLAEHVDLRPRQTTIQYPEP